MFHHPPLTIFPHPRLQEAFSKQQHATKMATYGFNNTESYFDSAMQDYGMEDEFTDALEHQDQYGGNQGYFQPEFPDNTATNSAFHQDSSYLPSVQNLPLPDGYANQYDHPPAQKVNQRYVPFAGSRLGHYNPADEPEETFKVTKAGASEKHTAAYHDAVKNVPGALQGQHTSGCSGSRGASTPPATPPPQPTQSSKAEIKSEDKSEVKSEPRFEGRVWLGPDDLRDVAKPVVREQRWHNKVASLHPNVPLAPHRYWVGVLNPTQNPKTASKEEHFTWMKGNRLTTVETVSRVYAATTMCEGVFMMGGERPELEVRMEELDLFNDKVVLFKVAEEGTPASVGRLITEGLVTKETELIELDD